MDFDAVNCRPKAVKCDGLTSFIMQVMCIVVAQKVRCVEDFGFEWQYIDTVYWLPNKTVWILCTIVEHQRTVSMSLKWAQRWASTECQRFRHCIMENPDGFTATFIHNRIIARLSIQKWLRQHHYYVLEMSIKRASTTSGLASWKMQGLCGNIKH